VILKGHFKVSRQEKKSVTSNGRKTFISLSAREIEKARDIKSIKTLARNDFDA